MTEPAPDKIGSWLDRVRNMTLGNVLIIFLLVVIAVPVYVIWAALHNEQLLNRLLSHYEEHPDHSGCMVRHVQARGGPDQWSVSSGFAVQGVDRYFVSVIRSQEQALNTEEVQSYCEALKLIVDTMRANRDTGPSDIP